MATDEGTTLEAAELGEAAAEPGARLYFRNGDRLQVIDLLDGSEVIVGRSPDAPLRIDDARVSREHARVAYQNGELRLTDSGSRNGTVLNRQTIRAASHLLVAGDLLKIGPAEIVVAAVGQPHRPVPTGDAPSGVVAIDPAMRELFAKVRRVARAPTTVLILGETGAGKEVVAEQIHLQSPRARGPFVRLNCGALPANLIESELFGHERGAFTGADRRKEGYLETARGGTLFLDEIGELSIETQARLLRVLEERRFMRVGGREELTVDARLIAATHRDLRAEAKTGRFREDLFFRLSSFVLEVPPLRQRREEILPLARLFVRRFAQQLGVDEPQLAADAQEALLSQPWQGNVRELRNAIEHAVVLCEGRALRAEQLPLAPRPRGAPLPNAVREQLEGIERKTIEEALAAESGNQTRAARRLGMSRRTLIYKMEKYELRGYKSGV